MLDELLGSLSTVQLDPNNRTMLRIQRPSEKTSQTSKSSQMSASRSGTFTNLSGDRMQLMLSLDVTVFLGLATTGNLHCQFTKRLHAMPRWALAVWQGTTGLGAPEM